MLCVVVPSLVCLGTSLNMLFSGLANANLASQPSAVSEDK